jgi:archaeosine synthase
MELELCYPAQHYDIPVTGDWSADEKEMLGGIIKRYTKKNHYEGIIAHLGSEEASVREILGGLGLEARFTSVGEKVTTDESLENLRIILNEMTGNMDEVSKHRRLLENMESISGFQFGKLGEKLFDGAIVKGSYPFLKIFRDEKQLGMLSPERGMLSLTLDGARILGAEKGYRVHIEDFNPQSTVFAVGVLDADNGIRIGDEVAIVHGEEVRGVGVAMMSPREMVESDRGVAVRVRHHV